MSDLSDHPFSAANIRYECGEYTPSERRFSRFCNDVSHCLGLTSLDGDQAKDGYSLDWAYDMWHDGATVAECAAEFQALMSLVRPGGCGAMRYAQIGSVSHGTLRNEDLLDTFAGELAHYARKNREELGQIETVRLLRLASEAENSAYYAEHEEAASELILQLMDELDRFAAPYCYFGPIEGDGSDFGFWPNMEQIEELPRVKDGDGAYALGEEARCINDHGNVTVYNADGSILLEIV